MKLENCKIGFIGAGNMANSLIRGLLAKSVAVKNLLAFDIDSAKLESLKINCQITSASAAQIASTVDVLVLAVKPQAMREVCKDLHQAISGRGCLIISIAAGINLKQLQSWLGRSTAIVRCMPNTPALVGKGATGLFANDKVDDKQKILAEHIMSAVGIALWLDNEAAIDTVTALSGSGPAYFFLFMEAMQETAVAMGLSNDLARQLTNQTALGAATLASNSNFCTAELRRQVTSPGGTTERALQQFASGRLKELVGKAMYAAEQRSKELGGT